MSYETASPAEAERTESGDETKSERSTSEEMIRTKSDEENALEDCGAGRHVVNPYSLWPRNEHGSSSHLVGSIILF